MTVWTEIAVLASGCTVQCALTASLTVSCFAALRRAPRHAGLRYSIPTYFLFTAYVVVVIPLGLFFPMWFAQMTGGLASTPDARLLLWAIGVIGLAAAVGYGWRRSLHLPGQGGPRHATSAADP